MQGFIQLLIVVHETESVVLGAVDPSLFKRLGIKLELTTQIVPWAIISEAVPLHVAFPCDPYFRVGDTGEAASEKAYEWTAQLARVQRAEQASKPKRRSGDEPEAEQDISSNRLPEFVIFWKCGFSAPEYVCDKMAEGKYDCEVHESLVYSPPSDSPSLLERQSFDVFRDWLQHEHHRDYETSCDCLSERLRNHECSRFRAKRNAIRVIVAGKFEDVDETVGANCS
mmetsp:Transcript_12581/g.17440  ORF Transcript_12581/g.17440 Transcript_12581/m.17440 type:complete len:226 (-) Transcript_12581:553-1230(-)